MMYRLAGTVRISVAGRDAIVEQPGKKAMLFSGEGTRLKTLVSLLASPCREESLRGALARMPSGSGTGDLVGRLVTEGVLVPWDLGPRLAELHKRTTLPSEWPAVNPGLETGRLLRESAGKALSQLPQAHLKHANLVDALLARRSARRFGGGSLALQELATLLSLSAGCTRTRMSAALMAPEGPPAGRTYPSGGALYPIEVIVYAMNVDSLPAGFQLYQPLPHRLVPAAPAQSTAQLASWLPNHPIEDAGVLLLLAIDFSRPSLGKYGERAYRLALLEAGHLAQNVLLVSVALGLAALPICGYDDEKLSRAAGLPFPDGAIAYVLAVGKPAAESHCAC